MPRDGLKTALVLVGSAIAAAVTLYMSLLCIVSPGPREPQRNPLPTVSAAPVKPLNASLVDETRREHVVSIRPRARNVQASIVRTDHLLASSLSDWNQFRRANSKLAGFVELDLMDALRSAFDAAVERCRALGDPRPDPSELGPATPDEAFNLNAYLSLKDGAAHLGGWGCDLVPAADERSALYCDCVARSLPEESVLEMQRVRSLPGAEYEGIVRVPF